MYLLQAYIASHLAPALLRLAVARQEETEDQAELERAAEQAERLCRQVVAIWGDYRRDSAEQERVRRVERLLKLIAMEDWAQLDCLD